MNSRNQPPPPPPLTVNGTPNLLSLPNVSSGYDTPISLMAMRRDDMPVIDPTHPVQPTFKNAPPSDALVGWYTVICGNSLNGPGA
jgi:hypothetical protein